MRIEALKVMLQQMAPHLSVADIVSVIFFVWNAQTRGFLLYMQNGEYWYTLNSGVNHTYELWKFPPPIPAFNQLPHVNLTFAVQWNPEDVNEFLKDSGSTSSLYLSEKDDAANG